MREEYSNTIKTRTFICHGDDEGVMVPPDSVTAILRGGIQVAWKGQYNPILTTWQKAMYYYGQDNLYCNWTFVRAQGVTHRTR